MFTGRFSVHGIKTGRRYGLWIGHRTFNLVRYFGFPLHSGYFSLSLELEIVRRGVCGFEGGSDDTKTKSGS